MATSNSTFNKEDESDQKNMSVDGLLIDNESPPNYVTKRKDQASEVRRELTLFQSNMKSMMETWFSKQDVNFSKILDEFADVKKSINFLSNKYDVLEKDAQELTNRVRVIEKNNLKLEPHLTALEAKIENMEQRARNCNLEISNLPEKRGENLLTIIECIAKLIKQPLSVGDISAIHRVPHSNPRNPRPRNIIVKFSSQIIRDNFISGVRLSKGITSDQIHVQGASQKIYLNEHLTTRNKILFRQARDIAKENSIRFVWIKHGVILTRADISSPVIAIREEKDLSKLKLKAPRN